VSAVGFRKALPAGLVEWYRYELLKIVLTKNSLQFMDVQSKFWKPLFAPNQVN